MTAVFVSIALCLLFHLSNGHSLANKEYVKFMLSGYISRLFNHATQKNRSICCADGQWEANAFLGYGAVLSIQEATSFFHYNGTGRIAFDDANKKSYISLDLMAYSPQIPVYSHFKTTTIKDFYKGTMYEIDDAGHCTKESIPRNMQLVCVPENAAPMTTGDVGTKVVSTYQFSKSNTESEQIITASVLRNGRRCVPVTVSHSDIFLKDVSHGTVFGIDVTDVTLGIKDPTIFVLPKSCDNHH